MFIVAICAASTGLAAAACYLCVFASDSADDIFLKGFRAKDSSPSSVRASHDVSVC